MRYTLTAEWADTDDEEMVLVIADLIATARQDVDVPGIVAWEVVDMTGREGPVWGEEDSWPRAHDSAENVMTKMLDRRLKGN